MMLTRCKITKKTDYLCNLGIKIGQLVDKMIFSVKNVSKLLKPFLIFAPEKKTFT